jgi:hypothetical protein
MKRNMLAVGLAVLLLAGTTLVAEAAGGGYRGGGRGYHGGGGYYKGGGGYYRGRGGYSKGGGYYKGGGGYYKGGGRYYGGTRGFFGGGFGWWGWPGWWRPYYTYSYPYYYYAAPPVVIQQGSTEYIQQDPSPPSAPQYWYYCKEAGAYYPYVEDCPSGWMQVVPQPIPPGR